MTTQEIVSKLWNLCNVLRDDGITYHQYVTELTYILFLKMAKETGTEEQIALLADLIGHESIETTRIYLRRTASEQQELVDKIVTW